MNKAVNKIRLQRKDSYLVAIHILLGIIAVVLPVVVPIVITGVLLWYIFVYSANDASKLQVLIFISYFNAMETLYRAAGVSFLPYETSKYIQIGLILVSLVFSRTGFTSMLGFLIILLVLPSAALFPPALYKNFVFTSFGIIALGFLVAFIGNQRIIFTDFVKILKSFLLPCISFVTFITLKTPKFSDINFSLEAHAETTGGFGSNQVATLLGAAICLIIIMADKNRYIVNRLVTFGLMIYFFLRAFLSFSRGGVIGLILSLVISFALFKKIKQSVLVKLGIILVLFCTVFILANNFTGGNLLLRYEGETGGTISGTRTKSLRTLSSGRTDYAAVDLEIWFDHILFGVGPGNSQFIRFKYGMFSEGAPHTEATRLLAENGIFGLIINLILVFWPVYIILKTGNREARFIKTMLFVFAYATTWHSAMRTGLTPLFYGLASMNILPSYSIKRSKVPQLTSHNVAVTT